MSKLHRAFYLQLLSLAVGLGIAAWVYRTYPVLQYLTGAQEWIAALGPGAAAAYPLLYAACNVFLFPAGAVAVGSGLFFGLWKGFAINVAGNTLATCIAFTISRRFGRGWIRQRFLRRPKWAALDLAIGREGWKIIFLAQVIPFAPVSLLNYLFGVTRIRFRTALLWTALAQAPTMFLYAYAGTLAQIGIRFLQKGHQLTPVEYAIWVGGFMVALAASLALARLAGRLLEEAKARAAQENGTATSPAVHPPHRPAETLRKVYQAEQAF
jgi:uncharacterized membrane protein YdjX (TVP38/TMEM64 family)